jgi:hypothetical protein
VVVDVLTDVDRAGFSAGAPTGDLPTAKHLILGQVFLDQALSRWATRSQILHMAVLHLVGLTPVRPHGIPGAELDDVRAASVEGCPGMPCGSPLGRSTGCHTPPRDPATTVLVT